MKRKAPAAYQAESCQLRQTEEEGVTTSTTPTSSPVHTSRFAKHATHANMASHCPPANSSIKNNFDPCDDTVDNSEFARDIEGVSVPAVLLGDAAYPQLSWLMKPYPDNGRLVRDKFHFNHRLGRARMTVECAFGRLEARWRFLGKRLDVDLDNVPTIVGACCVLHKVSAGYVMWPMTEDPFESGDCRLRTTKNTKAERIEVDAIVVDRSVSTLMHLKGSPEEVELDKKHNRL
ncbi:hypothetical protein Bbelb_051020 [Branchiostoma belcheri]|nr:hypothetical protein Bbelb_051020 [Branchiostoma belcheri]